ncbi:MAG: tRNA dihydrouridine synthase DusB [Oligoflexia bacterium]|nr:tRNA dihydrouridine synthase DusB [Oligoflexia bacterium]
MAGITDTAFRSFMREMGCGVVISELVSAHGIEHKSLRTIELTKFSEIQRPVGIQIFGEDAGVLSKAAQFIEAQGADFVDINLGCPVPKVVKKGAGSALLREPCTLNKILKQVKDSIKIPLTIKIRTGWDDKSVNAHDVVKAAADAGVSWVAIHGRTRAQGYSGRANWEYIKEVKSKASIPIIGNGDITLAKTAVDKLHESNCDGVMIGRGCLKNPWIFKQALELYQTGEEKKFDKDICHALGRLKVWVAERGDERYSTLQTKKFVSWFSSGYPGSQAFRSKLFSFKSAQEIYSYSMEYFSQFNISEQIDTSHENFLMGGHG